MDLLQLVVTAVLPNESKSLSVQLRLRVTDGRIQGHFRLPEAPEWTLAGECDPPGRGPGSISLQFYQGPEQIEHWARVTGFSVRRP